MKKSTKTWDILHGQLYNFANRVFDKWNALVGVLQSDLLFMTKLDLLEPHFKEWPRIFIRNCFHTLIAIHDDSFILIYLRINGVC